MTETEFELRKMIGTLTIQVRELQQVNVILSYNIRCLNIRQGSQPIELPDIHFEGPFDEVTFNHMVTPDEFENMVDTLVINEDHRYQDEQEFIRYAQFGKDETVWAK